MKVNCKQCGKKFEVSPYRTNAKFCSRECYLDSVRSDSNKVKCKCKQCGKTFYLNPSAIKQGKGKHCSRKCYGLSNMGKNNPMWSEGVSRTCKQCGKGFDVIPSQVERGRGNYCSRECYYKSKLKEKVKRICETCGKDFYVDQAFAEYHLAKYCSKDCYGASKRRENHSRWTGEIERECETCGKKYVIKPWYAEKGYGQYCSRECHHEAMRNDEELAEHMREIVTALQKMRPNNMEKSVYRMLNEIGCTYIPQARIGYYIVDAYIPAHKLVLEFDGDYWHAHPAKYKDKELNPKQKRMVHKDKSEKTYLINHGYRLLRFWETDIKKNPESVRDAILHELSRGC